MRDRGIQSSIGRATDPTLDTEATHIPAKAHESVESDPEVKKGRDHPKLTRAEAGRLGGLKTRELYGSTHYKNIGKQGGTKGGAVTKQKYGTEHYRRIGSMRSKKSTSADE